MEVKYSLQCTKMFTLFLQLCTVRALARAICSMVAVHCKMLCIFSFSAFIPLNFLCVSYYWQNGQPFCTILKSRFPC